MFYFIVKLRIPEAEGYYSLFEVIEKSGHRL